MTYGSCHSRWESNVQTCRNPWCSARRARSTTRQAGGSVCSTTPNSMRTSDQILGKAAPDEAAVALGSDVPGLILDDGAAGQNDVDVPVDLPSLPRRVVHVHVVGLADADRRMTVRVVDDDVRICTGADDALLAVHAEHPGRGRAADVHPALQRDAPVGHALVQQVHPVLDAAYPVGNLGEVADAHVLLVLHAERAVVRGHRGDIAGTDVLPEFVLVPLGAGAQRRRAHPLRPLDPGRAEVLLQREVEVLGAGLTEHVLAAVPGFGDPGQCLL